MNQNSIALSFAVATLLGLGGAVADDDWDLKKMVQRGERVVYVARPVDRSLINTWPKDWEDQFQERAHRIITAQTRDVKPGVNTYFENEKRSYGFLMAHTLGGNEEIALKYLQTKDHQHEQWHRETAGIDYYACFTLKHQIRKYFYFGDLLEPEYRKSMFQGAKRWTQNDPLRRPHYAYQAPKPGWGPDAKNSWVDVRSTENLYLMRVTSVFLMAEETGNQATAAIYKKQILDYAKTLFRIGIGEWDSENYLGHSIAPLLNLYDFARDRQVKAAAKACLDFYTAAGAVKYWRGGFNGPTKRDYNHAQPFGGSAANALWVWFGDHPKGKRDHWESDEVHQITSAYRPPRAVVHLARKQFPKPIEIFSAKPSYDATTQYRSSSSPEYLETQYIADSYLMGSLTCGTSIDGGDVNGFKMLVYDKHQGAVALHAAPVSDPNYVGSPMYKQNVAPVINRIAQQQNLVLWLAQGKSAPWMWVVPEQIFVEIEQGVTFLKSDQTWVAIRPLGAAKLQLDADLTQRLAQQKKPRFPAHKVLSTRGSTGTYSGLAIEVGEQATHQSFQRFKRSVLAAEVDTSELAQGIARYRADDGKWLGIHWNDNPLDLGVWRNGIRRDLKNVSLYQSPVISAKWGDGALQVTAGGEDFRCQVDDQGQASWSE